MKSTLSRLTAAMAATCALVACSTVTVTTDYDRSAPFSRYKTYTLAPAQQGQTLSPTGEAALRASLRETLATRGITEATSGRGDLAIARHAFLAEKVSVHQYTDWGYGYQGGWPYRYGTYGVWAGAPITYTDVNQYTQGTLVLDFVDTRTNKLVFRGTGEAIVGDPGSNASKISEAVRKIVAKLPVTVPQ
ncbi:MAG: DUF4136 domain-containing protein [Chthoniobacteraceae bacterium]